METSVQLTAVAKSYLDANRHQVIFEDLSVSLARGEICAITGRSGSGKSTLLNLISGIDLPERGEVTVSGNVINRMSERDRTVFRRDHVGFVFQSFNLIPTLTVWENVMLPLQLAGRRGDAFRQRGFSLLEQVGLADRGDDFPDRLSGGEQQRVAIVRAIVHEPTVLLADEPTGNLDAQTGQQVIELLLNMSAQEGTTVVLVTHSEAVAALAHRHLRVIDRGLTDVAYDG